MKNFALVIAFALLAAVPASAAEISKAAPVTTLEQQTQGAAPLFKGVKPVLLPYCSTLQGDSCPAPGTTKACTDICHRQLSCTCRTFYSNGTPSGNYWDCNPEC
jgi:hypothetical protein